MECDFLDSFLKLDLLEDLDGVAVNEKHRNALDLGVAGLDAAVLLAVLALAVAVEAFLLEPLHLVLPLDRNDLEQVVRRNVVAAGLVVFLVGGDVGAFGAGRPAVFEGQGLGLPVLGFFLPVEDLQRRSLAEAETHIGLVVDSDGILVHREFF